MIVSAMNSEELLKEILKDSEIVLRKSIYLTKSLRREAIKSKNKFLRRTYEHISKQKNNWLITIDYNQGDPKIFRSVYYINEFGINAVVVLSDEKTLVHYSSHFLERYNERFLKQDGLSKLDLLKRFLLENSIATYDFGKYTDEDYEVLARFKEGIGFGAIEFFLENRFIFLKTYITPDMIFENQQNGFNSISEAFEEQLKDSNLKYSKIDSSIKRIEKPYKI